MEQQAKHNGKADHGPRFAVITTEFAVLPATAILELFVKNGQKQAKGNLALGPLFRKVADDFRGWSKIAQPGCLFQAPEVNFLAICLAGCPPIATSLSEEAQKKAREAAAPAEVTTPRIAMP